jgi:hypothetical protein
LVCKKLKYNRDFGRCALYRAKEPAFLGSERTVVESNDMFSTLKMQRCNQHLILSCFIDSKCIFFVQSQVSIGYLLSGEFTQMAADRSGKDEPTFMAT